MAVAWWHQRLFSLVLFIQCNLTLGLSQYGEWHLTFGQCAGGFSGFLGIHSCPHLEHTNVVTRVSFLGILKPRTSFSLARLLMVTIGINILLVIILLINILYSIIYYGDAMAEKPAPLACDKETYAHLARQCPWHNAWLRIVRVNGRGMAFFECLRCEYREEVYPSAKKCGSWLHAIGKALVQVI